MYPFIVEATLILISAINFGHLITQDNEIFKKNHTVVYGVIIFISLLLFILNKYQLTWLSYLLMFFILINFLIINKIRKTFFTLLIGFITFLFSYAFLDVLIDGFYPQMFENKYFFILIFLILNLITLLIQKLIVTLKLRKNIQKFWKAKIKMGIIISLLLLLLIPIISNTIKTHVAINIIQILPVISFIILIIAFTLLFNFHKQQLTKQKLMQKEELSNQLKDYVNAIKASRHDYNSHLNAINQLVKSKQYKSLSEYVNSLIQEIEYQNSVSGIKFPEISALLFNHEMFAKKNHIDFQITFNSNLSKIPIKLYDLNKLLNNLVSNALEAALNDENQYKKQVRLDLNQIKDKFIIKISNNGEVPATISTNLFKPGITSKNDHNHGYGLFIIEKIVREYEGHLSIQENQHIVTIEIII